jgi:hypothetical protein
MAVVQRTHGRDESDGAVAAPFAEQTAHVGAAFDVLHGLSTV